MKTKTKRQVCFQKQEPRTVVRVKSMTLPIIPGHCLLCPFLCTTWAELWFFLIKIMQNHRENDGGGNTRCCCINAKGANVSDFRKPLSLLLAQEISRYSESLISNSKNMINPPKKISVTKEWNGDYPKRSKQEFKLWMIFNGNGQKRTFFVVGSMTIHFQWGEMGFFSAESVENGMIPRT